MRQALIRTQAVQMIKTNGLEVVHMQITSRLSLIRSKVCGRNWSHNSRWDFAEPSNVRIHMRLFLQLHNREKKKKGKNYFFVANPFQNSSRSRLMTLCLNICANVCCVSADKQSRIAYSHSSVYARSKFHLMGSYRFKKSLKFNSDGP